MCFQNIIISRMIVTISTSLLRSKSVHRNILDKTIILDESDEFPLSFVCRFRHQAQSSFSRMVCHIQLFKHCTILLAIWYSRLSGHNREGFRKKETPWFKRLRSCSESLPTRSFNLLEAKVQQENLFLNSFFGGSQRRILRSPLCHAPPPPFWLYLLIKKNKSKMLRHLGFFRNWP